ncbi:MerR family transcriptional regulator [Saccharopolyspora sp. CA-218241]|uniref:MerR family transcriptional regulator n=1 Tax=Saccharopolyspora sp. CA-218241 TaxID=3240027 RepID=UPI003D952513
MDDGTRYTIGELARRTGLSVKTIRFYADRGIVPPTDRTPAGYRLYDVSAIRRLELVRTLRELGAGLAEVRRVLGSETSVAGLARTHLDLLDEQLRVLQTRRAVLRAVVKLNRSTEEVKLMHKLARMSDEERDRLIDEFWNEVTAGLDINPEFDAWMRSARPALPDDPSAEQLEAWIELAELVQESDFRQAVRGLHQEHSDRRDDGEPMGVQTPEQAKRWWAVTDEAREAEQAGESPDGPRGRAVADRVAELSTEDNGTPDTPEARRSLAEDLEQRTDERISRFWELLATINGWPQHPTTAAATRWLAAALRATAPRGNHPGRTRPPTRS